MSQSQGNARAASLRRKAQYKNILERGSELAEQSENQGAPECLLAVSELLKESNQLLQQGSVSDRVGHTSEVVLDIQVLKMGCDLISSQMQKMENVQFSDEAYIEALNEYMPQNGGDDWRRFDNLISGSSKTVWHAQPMLGTFNIDEDDQPSESTQRQRAQRPRAQAFEEKRPQMLTQQVAKQKGSQKLQTIMTQITQLYEARDKKPLPYFEVIIDPQNMMNTFDNSLSLSFLFRDANIGFTKGEDGLPAIYPVRKEDRPTNAENKQFIATLDFELLQRMIAKYNITDPMLQINRDVPDDMPE